VNDGSTNDRRGLEVLPSTNAFNPPAEIHSDRVPKSELSLAKSSTNGLQAQYYEGTDLTNLKLTRTDATVNFNWDKNAPDSTLSTDYFSVRWTGQIQPKYSETYTFYTNSDDGIRLWVNGQLLIDNWTDHPVTENRGMIPLTAFQNYDIRLEYYEKTADSICQLQWSSASQLQEIVPQSQLFSGSELLAAMRTEQAKSAHSFVDSIGINTHLHYYDTPYGNFSLVEQRLKEAGIRHIRDGGSDPTWIDRINQLGKAGIKTTVVLDPNIGVGPTADYDIKPPHYQVVPFVKNLISDGVAAVEILNEFDIFHQNGYSYKGKPVNSDNWVAYVRDFTRDTFNHLESDPATKNIPIIGPSFVYGDSSTKVGDLSQWIDYGNMHPYTYPSHPGNGNLQSELSNRSKPSKSLPLIATEAGFHTASPSDPRSVTETVQSKYIPRMFLQHFNQGVYRTFSYELLDQKPNPNDGEANFGIVRYDGSPKPAFTAMKNLIGLLSDTGETFTPGTLNYSFSGNTQNLNHTLLQKRNGDFYMVMWLEVPSTDKSTSQQVTLNLNTPIGQATTYLPNQATNAIDQFSAPKQLTLTVPDAPIVVKLSPR
jgi:hypothetical protein